LFNEDTPYKLITELKPDVVVKGKDYKPEEIVGWGIVPKVVRVDIVEGFSTTGLIKKIKGIE
jgi:D-beta-D-heptose 7-phosphate kinase/D-beta-D-heptose 1-phosphate adenosyltransferase